ncbi:DUF501 domain-containing protein [Micropruina sp.]|uniref:DUF501 domain-containing protein n=1 Tax=Micropruina sp. TaxID=2737536 RepID=UPI0039E6B477
MPAVIDPVDVASIEAQLGRAPRGLLRVAWRCANGDPGVVVTAPRLPDGTPFPTLYYLTCPHAVAGASTLEAQGLMADMTARLADDAGLAQHYRRAHESYLAERRAFGVVPEIDHVSAGGMPTRVKCLHVLVAHSLAVGPGVNPLGDEAVALLRDFPFGECLGAT